MARYILELEPFKSLPVQQIAETIAPNLQRYLTGDLPGLADQGSARSSRAWCSASSVMVAASEISSTGTPASIR